MDRFDAAAAQLASLPTTWTVGYCHGSEDGMMRTIRAFRAQHPGAVVRPDGLTSLLILEGLCEGRIAVGIVRGPVTEPGRVASVPLARVPVDHVAVPPDHRLAGQTVIQAQDLDDEPVLVVERSDGPTAHDEIQSYCTAMGAHPRWITHAAVQVERVLDLVALGTGIGWLNSWQAQRGSGREDVVVRPLQPVQLYDEFRVAWRAGDPSATTAAFVRVALETCSD
jgi:DNA-binding transcriptional LysR family regulator